MATADKDRLLKNVKIKIKNKEEENSSKSNNKSNLSGSNEVKEGGKNSSKASDEDNKEIIKLNILSQEKEENSKSNSSIKDSKIIKEKSEEMENVNNENLKQDENESEKKENKKNENGLWHDKRAYRGQNDDNKIRAYGGANVKRKRAAKAVSNRREDCPAKTCAGLHRSSFCEGEGNLQQEEKERKWGRKSRRGNEQ